jgi:hypothetical protein
VRRSLPLVLLCLASSSDVRGWLDDWAPLAEWFVALGTILLASATFVVASRAKSEVQAVRSESEAVTDQVKLQREQMEAARRPVVYPVTPADWAKGAAAATRRRLLPVANGGPGVALNVMGHLMRRPDRGSGYQSSQILAGSVGPGAQQDARLEGEWTEWQGTIGYLRYWDLLGEEWITDFTCAIAVGEQLSIEAKPPRRADAPGPEYPPPEWNQPRD